MRRLSSTRISARSARPGPVETREPEPYMFAAPLSSTRTWDAGSVLSGAGEAVRHPSADPIPPLGTSTAMTRTSSGFCRLPLLVALGLVGCGGDSPSPTAPSAPDPSPTAPDTPLTPGNARALSFDGSNDRVTVPYSASFPTEVFTIAARVQLSPPRSRAAILARGEDDVSLNLSWQLYVLADGTLEIMLEDSRENNMCYPSNSCAPRGSCDAPNPFVADGAWHHVAASRDGGGNLAVFVDGMRRRAARVPASLGQ